MVKKRTALNSDRSCWRCRRSSRGGEISGRRCLKMKSKLKKWLRPLLFTIGGALAGLGYYYAVGCSTGSCPITSNPIITKVTMTFRCFSMQNSSPRCWAWRRHRPMS